MSEGLEGRDQRERNVEGRMVWNRLGRKDDSCRERKVENKQLYTSPQVRIFFMHKSGSVGLLPVAIFSSLVAIYFLKQAIILFAQ